MDILSNPIVVALFALLAIPAVTSALAGFLKSAQTSTGINAKVFVYVASAAVTGLILVVGGLQLPVWAGEPALYVGAWLAWLAANAELARRLYEALNERIPVAY